MEVNILPSFFFYCTVYLKSYVRSRAQARFIRVSILEFALSHTQQQQQQQQHFYVYAMVGEAIKIHVFTCFSSGVYSIVDVKKKISQMHLVKREKERETNIFYPTHSY